MALPVIVWTQGTAQPSTPARPATPAPTATAGAKTAGTPAAAAAPGAAVAGEQAQEPYSYSPDGRRDPFISLVARGIDNTGSGKHADGLGNIETNELLLRGVMQSKGAYFALVQSPDGKTYTAHVNDHLADGVIRSITPQGMVIMQEVNDPLSLIKQREVRKGLRASDDVKQ